MQILANHLADVKLHSAEQIYGLEQKVRALEGELVEARHQLGTTQVEMEHCMNCIHQLKQENSKKWRVEERDDWKGLVDAIQSDRATLQEENEALQKELKEMRSQLAEAQQNEIKRTADAVKQCVNPQPLVRTPSHNMLGRGERLTPSPFFSSSKETMEQESPEARRRLSLGSRGSPRSAQSRKCAENSNVSQRLGKLLDELEVERAKVKSLKQQLQQKEEEAKAAVIQTETELCFQKYEIQRLQKKIDVLERESAATWTEVTWNSALSVIRIFRKETVLFDAQNGGKEDSIPCPILQV